MQNIIKAIMLLCLASSVDNAIGADERALHSLMRRLASVDSVHAHFKERKYLSILETPIVLTGILYYRAPDYIKKQTLFPHRELLEIRRQTLVVESPEQGKMELLLHEYPAVGAFVESIRSTLAGDLDKLKRFYRITPDFSGPAWQIQLRPRAARMRQYVDRIVLRGRNAQIIEVETVEAQGDRSVMQIAPRAE